MPPSLLRTLAAATALAVVLAATASARPRLRIIGGTTHNWGTVAPGTLTAAIRIRNAGTGRLRIREVDPNCTCIQAQIDKTLLWPGEIATVDITYDVTIQTGAVHRIVTISSNDPRAHSRDIHLRATVRRAITCTPMQYMLMTNARMGVEGFLSPMRVRNTSTAPVTLEVPELTRGNIKVRFDMTEPRVLKPGEEFWLNARATPMELTSMSGVAVMRTSSSEMPALVIYISGTMMDYPAPPAQPLHRPAAPKRRR